MKIKAFWKSKNPFISRIERMGYTKTVEVPDDTDLDELKKLAEEDSRHGYAFDRFEIL